MFNFFAENPAMLIPAILFAVSFGVLAGLLAETLTRQDK